MKQALAAWALVLNAFVWGLSWWPLRELLERGLHPLWATAIVFGLALGCLLFLQPGAWRGLLRHPLLWLLMVASGVTNVAFNWAVTIGDVVRVVLLFYLMPVWSMLLAWAMLGERPGAGSVLRLALALAGVVVVLKSPASPWPVPSGLPDWLALLGGICFALTSVLLRKLSHTPDEARGLAMFGGATLLALAAALAGTAQGSVPAPPALALSWVVPSALLSLAFLAGNLALQYGAARLSAHSTALILLSEVVFASVSSVASGAAALDARTLLGGMLIMLAALWAVKPNRGDAGASLRSG